jgi:hypothetical protein
MTDQPVEPDEDTVEQTLEQTQPLPSLEAQAEPKTGRAWPRFLPLLLLLLAIAAAAIVLWVLAR